MAGALRRCSADHRPSATAPSPFLLRLASEAAALAAHRPLGEGRLEVDGPAAVAAMRARLGELPFRGTVTACTAAGGDAAFRPGEILGTAPDPPAWDLVLDPLEGTTWLGPGRTNALAAVALAPRGSLFDPGPCFYMEKLIAPAAAAGALDPRMPTREKLERLAECLDRPVRGLTVYLLEKPRHNRLLAEIRRAGARVALHPAGDVAGAVMAAIPGSGIDALMGTGGAVEGLLAACAVRALGGVCFARLDPQLAGERRRVAEAGLDTTRWLALEELVTAPEVTFCATGITDGLLLEGVRRQADRLRTQTLMLSGLTGEHQLLTGFHLPATPSRGAPRR